MSNVALIDAITTNTNLCHVIGKGIALLFPNGAESDKRPINLPHPCVWVGSCAHTCTNQKVQRFVYKASLIYIYMLLFQNILIATLITLTLTLFLRINFKVITLTSQTDKQYGFWTLYEISPHQFCLTKYLEMCFVAVISVFYIP